MLLFHHSVKLSSSFIKFHSPQSLVITQNIPLFKISFAQAIGTVIMGIQKIKDSSKTNQKDSDLNYGINICINNDDPTIFNTEGVNYDFFICAACMEFDLFDFKN